MITLYIDESGEAGIAKIRSFENSGASPYFVLGAAACRAEDEATIVKVLQECRTRINKKSWKHATDLNHSQKVYLAETLSTLPIRLFGIVSNKATLKGYADRIENDSQKFYNKCAVYLLEIVARYMIEQKISVSDTQIIFEHRNHDYEKLRRYIRKIKNNPIDDAARALKDINTLSISSLRKGESDMLDIADFVAHALYSTTQKTQSNFGIPESKYLVKMQSRFACNSAGLVLDHGIKCIHRLGQLALDPDIASDYRALRAKPAMTPE